MLSTQELANAPGLLSRERTDLSIIQKAELLDATRWSMEFSFEQMKKLVRYMSVYEVPPETVLFCEGEKNAYMVLIAKGKVRPAKGPRFFPRPVKVQPSDKTAADWVADGRR